MPLPSPGWGWLGRVLEAVADDLGQGGYELWSVVEGSGPANLQAGPRGEGRGLHVEVIKDLQVVGDEADRTDQDAARPRALDRLQKVGTEPGLPGAGGRLEGATPPGL